MKGSFTLNMEISHLGSADIVVLSLLVFAWSWQLWFLFKRIMPLGLYKPSGSASTPLTGLPPVSVIICAKNEASNLRNFLPEILTQDYPKFQVVVVNDNSEDDTAEVLTALKTRYPHLYTTTLNADKKFYSGKKVALSIGIKAALHENLILTDADCKPASKNWLKHMAGSLQQPEKSMVLGIGNYQTRKGLTNLWIRYDTFCIATRYLGYALSGKPYMGVGRNLAYKKSLHINNNGFKSHLKLASGDDDLFVQEAASGKNVTVCIHPEAHTISTPAESFIEWLHQKRRHLTTSSHYRPGLRFELAVEPLTRELIWIIPICCLFFDKFAVISLAFWVSYMMLKLIFMRMAAVKTGLGPIYWSIIGFDFLQPLILAWAHTGNISGTKNRKWN